MVDGEDLSALEVLVLRSLPRAKDLEDLAKIAKVPPATLGREIARLQIGGYIGVDGTITEKGLKAVQTRSKDAT
jgi:hypothetical protein